MKRLSPDDSSLDALIPICPNSTDEECNNPMLQAMLEEEEEECADGRIVVEKKRRLGVDQVRALEKNFEVENKLEPERKVKLAQELGLQPRQVAVWFQNRRARWKTKQLEKDYGVLKANYDSLKLSFDKLHHENETLLNEIGELKNKLNEETKTRVVKEEGMEDQTPNNNITDEDNETPILSDELLKSHEEEEPTSGQQHQNQNQNQIHVSMFFTDHGSSDSSESSAILNEDNANTTAAAVSSYSGSSTRGGLGFLQKQQLSVVYDETHEHPHHHHHHHHHLLHQFVKIEEHNFFGEEESCSGLMFSEDQAPTLQHWYSSDEWDLN